MMRYIKKQDGFSLIEIAIGMAILGVLAAGFLSLYQTYRAERHNVEERTSHEKITTALAAYLQKNGRYPCPAAANLNTNNANFGKAVSPCITTPVAQGTLPVVDLNLPFDMIGDSYGSKLTYAVTSARTDPTTYNSAVDSIQVFGKTRDASNNLVDANKMVPFIIVGHGPDMKGAYRVSGTSVVTPCGSSALDSENCDGDNIFRDEPFAPMSSANNSNHFDDSVILSLVQKETTLWIITPDNNGINIVNRNTGNIGIGVDDPGAKLSIRGGNLNIDAGGASASGNIKTNGTIEVKDNAQISGERIEAERNIYARDAAEADQEIRAGRFCYNIDIAACN